MLNAQSPLKYQYISEKPNHYQSSSVLKFPPIQSQSPQNRNNRYEPQDFNHRNSPLRRSQSMSQVLQGGISSPGSYYIDELQRFQRNHEAKNKEQRDKQRQALMNKLQQKRSIKIQRQEQHKKSQQDNLRSLIEKNSKILQARHQGVIKNDTYDNSLPVNPITMKYEQTLRGRYQKQLDDKAQVRKLVRGHHLQTMGTSGYNIVTGATINHTERIVAKNKDIEPMYQDKLEKFYSNLKIKPQSLDEFQQQSAKKIFKYY